MSEIMLEVAAAMLLQLNNDTQIQDGILWASVWDKVVPGWEYDICVAISGDTLNWDVPDGTREWYEAEFEKAFQAFLDR